MQPYQGKYMHNLLQVRNITFPAKLILNCFLTSFLSICLFSCVASDPPLEGKRINVLHYDDLEKTNNSKTQIKIPPQINNTEWKISDIGQYTSLPLNIKLGNSLKQKNSFSSPGFVGSFDFGGAVIIVNNIFYSYNKTKLSAYDVKNNKFLWSNDPVESNERDDVLDGAMAYDKGIIYLSTGSKDFVAIDAKDGSEKWRAVLPNVASNIALVEDNYVYITSLDNKISCFNAKNGELIWRHNAASYSIINSRLYLPSIIYENAIVTITSAGDLIILDKKDGREIAEVNLSAGTVIGDGTVAKGPIASPLLYNHAIYILTGENELIKVNLINPGIAWRQIIPNAQSFWSGGEAIYVLTSTNMLVSLNDDNGKFIWTQDISSVIPGNEKRELLGPILAADKLLITEGNGGFYFLSPQDGSLISSYKLDTVIDRLPLIVNEKIYFIGYKGKVSVWE